jgi:hypothetical protein
VIGKGTLMKIDKVSQMEDNKHETGKYKTLEEARIST